MDQTTKKGRYFIFYTISFLVALCAAFIYFPWYHKSFVWKFDGLYQHYNALVYYGKYLREIARNLIQNHTLTLPMWDMSIGYGSDVITTLNYYVLGDPLCLLSAFVPSAYTEYLYGFLICLRLYLAGLAFGVFCRYKGSETVPTIIGSLAYAFCGFALFASMRHPSFANPMIYLPVILYAINRIFDRKSPALYILMITIAAVSNFYFFYMIGILIVIYTIIEYILRFQRIRVKELLSWIGKFTGYSIIGVGMSLFTLLPVIMSVMGTDRMSAVHYIPKLYQTSFYKGLFADFLGSDFLMASPRFWTVLGFIPLALLTLIVMFSQIRKNLSLKIWFLVLTIITLVPFLGHVMNGFSYVSNRWGWGYAFVICYIMTMLLPELSRLTVMQGILMVIGCAVYAGLCYRFQITWTLHTRVSLCILGILVLVSILASFKLIHRKLVPVIYLLSTFVGIGVNAYFLYSPQQTDYIGTFRDQGYPIKAITTDSQSEIMHQIEDPGLYRYDQFGNTARENTAMQQRLYGTDYYFSITNGAISEYFEDLRAHMIMEWMFDHLDTRSIMDRLAAVKYFIVNKGASKYTPYSYDFKVTENDRYELYESEDVLPFGYTYENAIAKEQYESYNTVQKQQALLQGVVTDSEATEKLTLCKPVFDEVTPKIKIKTSKNIVMDGNTIEVYKAKSKISISFTPTEKSEVYLLFDNVRYEGEATNFSFKASMDGIDKKIPVYTYRNSFYSGKDDFLCNLGYFDSCSGKIKLEFPVAGVYSMENITVVCQPMEKINGYVENLGKEVLEDISFGTNQVSGKIHTSTDKFLLMPIAYSKGWKAMVDGVEVPVYRANGMFFGCNLTAGSHDVVFTYSTPYLKTGIILTVLFMIIFIILLAGIRIIMVDKVF